jgi:diacylglycerol kinase family enzyme
VNDRIAVITNLRSRQNRKDPGLAVSLQAQLGPGDVLEVTQSFDELDRAIVRLSSLGVRYLAINGGDGTNHRTLTSMIHHWKGDFPRIVLLRGGTMNTVSNGFGGSGTPRSILRRLRDLRNRGGPLVEIPRRLLRLQDGERDHYGFIFGTGVVYNFLEEYYRGGDVTPVTAATTLSRLIGSTVVGGALYRRLTARASCDIETDGTPWRSGDFVGVLAATQPQIGLGFRPFHRAEEHPDFFPLIAIDGAVIDVVRSLPDIRAGRTPVIEGYHERVVQQARILATGMTKYVVDGELYSTNEPLQVSMGPLLRVMAL